MNFFSASLRMSSDTSFQWRVQSAAYAFLAYGLCTTVRDDVDTCYELERSYNNKSENSDTVFWSGLHKISGIESVKAGR